MKKMKRLEALLLTLCLLATMLPTISDAASVDDLTFELSSDGTSYVVADCNIYATGNLVIPATYNGEPVTGIGEYAFNLCTSLQNVTIPDTVTYIQERAFKDCTSLTDVIIGTSVNSIGEAAFIGCTALQEVNIPDSVTYIGTELFTNCRGLSSVTIGNGVTSIVGYTFTNCSSLVDIKILGNVTQIGGSAFKNCTKLQSIRIPDSVTSIGFSAFNGCTSLKNITMPNSVTSIGEEAFYNCTGLQEITISDSVTSIGKNAFYNCTGLQTITIPDGVTTIGEYAFKGCTSLISVEIPDSITSFGSYSFQGCTSLNFNIYNNAKYLGNSENPYVLLFGSIDSSIDECVIHSKTKIIRHDAFYYCTKLNDITIPDSVVSIGDSAFSRCFSLSNINIPDSVTYIGADAFSYCKGLSSVTIGNGVTKICDSTFKSCTSLRDIRIPESVTSIGKYAFVDCSSLTSITIPESVTYITQSAFNSCNSLKDVYYYGTEAKWAQIYIGTKNESLTKATIHFVEPVLIGVSVKTLPTKTQYWIGESLNTTGLTLTATYSDGSVETVTVGFTVSGFDNIAAGTQTITATYEGFVATFDVTVSICEHTAVRDGDCIVCGENIGIVLTDSKGNVTGFFVSLTDALAVVTENHCLMLQVDLIDTDVVVPSNTLLDLNGYTLTADSVLTYSSSAIVDTSEDASGLLIINKSDGNMISANNSQLPVYDNANGGYRFFAIDVDPCAVTGKNSGTPKYWFKIRAEKFAPLYELIQADSEVQIKVKMIWDGQSEDTYAAADLVFTQTWAQKYNANKDIYITVTATGAEGLENFTLTPCIVANGVEISGEEM